jgi:hypothetical protein
MVSSSKREGLTLIVRAVTPPSRLDTVQPVLARQSSDTTTAWLTCARSLQSLWVLKVKRVARKTDLQHDFSFTARQLLSPQTTAKYHASWREGPR